MDQMSRLRLTAGDSAPQQQSTVSCGSACLVVARMMLDPALTRWVRAGLRAGSDRPDQRPESARFAELERGVMARTNARSPYPDVTQLPWPRFWGTAPWGARAELEHGAALPGTAYRVGLLRLAGSRGLAAAHQRLAMLVRPGRPALLYVGSQALPRHVALVFADEARPQLLVYEPSQGSVSTFDRDDLARRQLSLGGWRRPWLVVAPAGQVTVESPTSRRARAALPTTTALSTATRSGGWARTAQPVTARTTSRTSKASAAT